MDEYTDPQALSAIEEAELEVLQQRFVESGVAAQVDGFLADPSAGVELKRPDRQP